MRRLACLLLLVTPALAWAAGVGESDHGSCVTPGSAAHGPVPEPTAAATPTHPAPTSHRGGGDDSELLQPRGRMPKWHSFLPGMFR